MFCACAAPGLQKHATKPLLDHFFKLTSISMMKKAPSSNDKDQKGKRKASRTSHLGNFGIKLKKSINGKEHAVQIPDGRTTQTHQHEDCKQYFDNAQVLSGHRVHCEVEKLAAAAL